MRYLTKAFSILVVLGFCAAIILVVAPGISSMWMFESHSVEGGSVTMGTVDVSINQPEVIISGSGGVQNFEITNNSKIPFYLRIGYTFVCRDAQGNMLAVDIPDDLFTISIDSLAVDTQQLSLSGDAVQQLTVQGYHKRFITCLAAQDGNYILFPADSKQITGTVSIQVNEAKYPGYLEQAEGSWHLVLVPEAMQATESAVQSLTAYGWNPSLVGEQIEQVELSTQIDGIDG